MDLLDRARRRPLQGRLLILLIVAAITLAAVVLPAATVAEPAPATSASGVPLESASPEPSPSPSEEPLPTAITSVLSGTSVVYGATITVSGAVTPATEGQDVIIFLAGVAVADAATGADGSYSAEFIPRRSGEVVARLAADGAASLPQQLAVRPKVTITHGTPVPFLPLRYVITVAPSSYAGTVSTAVWHNGVKAATVKTRVTEGKAVQQLPLRGVGLFTLKTTLPPGNGLAGRSIENGVRAKTVTLRVGSSGPHVRGLLTALKALGIRVPYVGTKLNADCGDAVMAFQKAYRLPRTYVVDADDWRKLDTAKKIKPRYSTPYDHLEVDKTRQILLMVRGGSLRGLIAVSTGATGNTPEGSFRIQQKHPYTTTWLGPGILYRTMGFHGNFAIHGYRPVPPYPASHGCIREPMWVAAWIYDRSFVGERLYIYR
jgi:peptidoglycan hydrolase-like protein with peptidoglycan-binding domain